MDRLDTSKDRDAICLTEDQAKHIYKKVETENIANIDTIKWEVEVDRLDKMDYTNGKINPCHEIIKNKIEKENTIISQIEQWSIPRNIVNYVQCDRHSKSITI